VLPRRDFQSVGFTPDTAIRTRTSPAPGSGTGRSTRRRTPGPPVSEYTTARIYVVAGPVRSTIKVVMAESSVQSRWAMPRGHRACCPSRMGAVSPASDVKPSPSRQTTMVSFSPRCSWIVACSGSGAVRRRSLLADEDAPDDADTAVERQRIPAEARKRTDFGLTATRARRGSAAATGRRPRPRAPPRARGRRRPRSPRQRPAGRRPSRAAAPAPAPSW
jgi:hypothetical protein